MKNGKLFKTRRWEALMLVFATLFVILLGGYKIAMNYAAAINSALGIASSEITRSDDAAYQYFPRTYTTDEDMKAYYISVCEEVESEGLVLMKNENDALPLDGGAKLSLFFSGAVRFNYGSTGSSASNTDSYKDLKTALTDQKFSVNEALWNFYADEKGRTKSGETYKINEIDFEDIDEDALDAIEDFPTAIVVFARDSGEGADISSSRSDGEDKSYLSISAEEESVLIGLTELKAEGKVDKIIAVLNSSATLELDFLWRDDIDVDAVMWVGNVGVAGIDAVAKVLTGEYVPSGKLSDTYLRDNFSSPAMAQQSFNTLKSFAGEYTNSADYNLNETQKYFGIYNEGIYVGYRYYETRYEDYVNGAAGAGKFAYGDVVAFPFGYGKSYTEFSYSDFAVAEKDGGKSFEVSVKVTNDGKIYSGKEVVEIYLQKPYTDYDKENAVEKASVELVGYAKTGVLAPGASETLTVEVSKDLFKSYDANKAKTYIVDAGTYYLTAAGSSHEAINNILAAKGKTPANTDGRMDAEGNAAMVYSTNLPFDDKTYAVSSYTGKPITNLLDFADLNKYENSPVKVTYVSRSDWEGTWPTAKIDITLNDKMGSDLMSNQPYEEEAGAEMPKYDQKNGLNLIALRGKAYDDPMWDQLLDQMSFGDQAYLITSGYYSTVVVESVGKPDTKESDGPTGLTYSKFSLSFPSEGIWASSFNNELITKVGDALAEDALNLGLAGIYAGGINIHRTPFGGRSHEYFSEDPFLTGSAAAAETNGLQAKGVISNIKHFVFNDEETFRNGIGIWLNEQEAREIMLYPFEVTLAAREKKDNAHAVMTSFNRAGTKWTGANTNLLFGLLNDEWGFEGYNITDMASSNGATYMTFQDGILYGTNVFLSSGTKNSLDEFKNSPTIAQRMRETCHRVLYNMANYSSSMNGISSDTSIGATSWWWRTALIAAEVVFGVLAAGAAVMYGLSLTKAKKKD